MNEAGQLAESAFDHYEASKNKCRELTENLAEIDEAVRTGKKAGTDCASPAPLHLNPPPHAGVSKHRLDPWTFFCLSRSHSRWSRCELLCARKARVLLNRNFETKIF